MLASLLHSPSLEGTLSFKDDKLTNKCYSDTILDGGTGLDANGAIWQADSLTVQSWDYGTL